MHPILPRSALRRDRWRTALNTTRRRNPEPTYSPRERIVGIRTAVTSGVRATYPEMRPPDITRAGGLQGVAEIPAA